MKYIDNRLNANIVKLEDANNNYTSDNVEGALEEIDSKIKDIEVNGYDDTQIKQDINSIKTKIGTEELTTTDKTIKGAINEVNTKIGNAEGALEEIDLQIKNIESQGYDDTEIRQDINNIKNEIGSTALTTNAINIKDAINKVNSRINTIEVNGYDDTQIRQDINNIKNEISSTALTTTDKTIKGAINEVNTKIGTIKVNGYDDTEIKDIMQKKIYQFSDIATMKKYNLKVGEVCETLGYYTVNDLGGAKYYITNDSSLTADGGSVHTLNNGLKAKLIVNNDLVNVRQFGAKGDGTTDDTNAINTALKTFDNVFMPPGNYFINSTIKMRLNTRLNGSFYKTTVLLIGSNLKDKNVIEYGSSYAYNSMNGKISNIKLQPKDDSKNIGLGIYLYSSLHMDNVYFYKLQCCIKKNSGYIDNIRITNCNFCYCIGTSSQYIIDLLGAGDGLEIRNIHLVDAYTNLTSGESQYTKYRGIHITDNSGGIIENCIINGPISLYNCKGFKISNLHVEGSQHGNYKGNLSWINICNSKVKMENIFMHKRVNGPNIKIETYATSDPKESNDVIIENLYICYPKHLMSLMKCYNDDNSFDIDKDKLSTLKLKNCFVYSDFSSTWTTTNLTVGVRIKGIDDFNKHSSYYSNNCEVGICNNVLTDIPACKNNPEYKDTSIFSYSSSNSNIPWFESNCNETKQFITGVYCFDYERRLALLKNTVELEIPTTTTTTSASGKGIMLRNPYSSILDGIGLELIIYRGKSSNNYNKITRVPCCTSYFIFDYGTNIMGIPTKTRTASSIDDFNYVIKFRTINGGENVEFYASAPPVYGTFKKFDRCINTNISDSEPKKWIYDGSTWVALN